MKTKTRCWVEMFVTREARNVESGMKSILVLLRSRGISR
jgi:hypothetical protein